MEFNEWLTQKYIEWRGDAVGREKNISDFARSIGVKQQVLSGWMKPNGNIPHARHTIEKLHLFFGDEIYEILGLDKPNSSDPQTALINHLLKSMTPNQRTYFIAIIREFADTIAPINDPENYEFAIREYKASYGPVIKAKRKPEEREKEP